jgi:hypothetical protein
VWALRRGRLGQWLGLISSRNLPLDVVPESKWQRKSEGGWKKFY